MNNVNGFASRLPRHVKGFADDSFRAFACDDSFGDGAITVIFHAFDTSVQAFGVFADNEQVNACARSRMRNGTDWAQVRV
ncbi:MAG: hypothetical protein HYR70_05675 [Chloroflexi bacterium]|nr:hypothetical protein [Chloroflexota bacterium]MBI1854414.1 hypothetical protein [Chloroflexota bacterium]MBI3338724.1 hypothetical protein [Chloroflexota bacterium]